MAAGCRATTFASVARTRRAPTAQEARQDATRRHSLPAAIRGSCPGEAYGRLLPKLLRHDAQMRRLEPLPLTARVDAGHLAPRLRVADLADAVSNDAAAIDLVTDHPGGSLRRSVNGRGVPGAATQGLDTLSVEGGRDVAAGVASGIVAEDAQHHRRLVAVDLVIAGPAGDRPIAVGQAADALPLCELAGKSAARLQWRSIPGFLRPMPSCRNSPHGSIDRGAIRRNVLMSSAMSRLQRNGARPTLTATLGIYLYAFILRAPGWQRRGDRPLHIATRSKRARSGRCPSGRLATCSLRRAAEGWRTTAGRSS